MIDREKVIKGLEVCVDREPGKYDCYECPYEIDGNYCEINLTKDVLALLKEQDAVEPINSYGTFRCGNCRNIVGYNDGHWHGYQNNFCSKCGKAVKWE